LFRFVYGQKKEFKNVNLAMDVYKFAHKKQIDGLTSALDDFIKKTVTVDTVLKVYKFYKAFDHASGLEVCKEVGIIF